MASVYGPVAGRRRLRSALRRAREAAGLTQEQVAAAMDWSLSKLIRIEAGNVSISTNDVKALLHHYQLTDPAQVGELVELARASRRRAWWARYKDQLPAQFLSYLDLEAEARTLHFFQSSGIPGLLQTEAYARAALAAFASTTSAEPLDPAEADMRHAIRMYRQRQILHRATPPEIDVVLDEAVLHRRTGGRECIRAQLLHLVAMASAPHVTIRVLPFTTWDYAAQPPFILLRFPDPDDADLVYQEGVLSNDMVERPESVDLYRRTFHRLRELSLSADESLALIGRIAADLA